MLIPIEKIRVGRRIREIREPALKHLAESIAEVGLLNPISVVAGAAHRDEGPDILPTTSSLGCTVWKRASAWDW